MGLTQGNCWHVCLHIGLRPRGGSSDMLQMDSHRDYLRYCTLVPSLCDSVGLGSDIVLTLFIWEVSVHLGQWHNERSRNNTFHLIKSLGCRRKMYLHANDLWQFVAEVSAYMTVRRVEINLAISGLKTHLQCTGLYSIHQFLLNCSERIDYVVGRTAYWEL